jgi:hypothetical protein
MEKWNPMNREDVLTMYKTDNFLYRPFPSRNTLEEGEQLGQIRSALCLYPVDDEETVRGEAKIAIDIDLYPDGHDESTHMTYSIPNRWEPLSKLHQTLEQLECLPLEGDRLNLYNLMGVAVMVTIELKTLTDGREINLISNIRKATESEATRTDWDLEDNSLEMADDFGENQQEEAIEEQESDEFDTFDQLESKDIYSHLRSDEDEWDDLS